MSHKYSRFIISSQDTIGHSKQGGSALIIGVFIITVMFLLAATLINVLNDADQQISLEVWGTRAFAAANSGADRALAELFPVAQVGVGACNANTTWHIEAETIPNTTTKLVGFHGCSVVISCNAITTTSLPINMTQYLITSTATCSTGQCDSGTDSDASCIRVNRTVEVEARD
ncbi:MSHA biogenesis protein MshP [Shewanella gelidimarina]|uniref:MSHA biogenesis protein MshP n=1 Tax=Shewanella gelidimarina TaxID=56813 RepID=UPI00200BF414|nr:MSHA biogenesis protein MshP [Shewanella gelidimarina]MCL1057135.1 MSHA biogenesis protein MshP [Shewanella gelidimarina]